MRIIAAIITVFCLSFALPAHAVKLEYKVKQGDTWKQKLTMRGDGAMEAGGMKFDMVMETISTTANKVTSVAANGDFVSTVEYKPTDTKMTVNGMSFPSPPQQAMNLTVTTTRLGKPLKVEGLEKAGVAGGSDFTKFMNIAPAQFPDKDIQVGESWDASPPAETFPAKITGKLLSVKGVGGKQVAEVEYTFKISGEALGKLIKQLSGMDIDIGGPGMTGTSVTLVDVASGIPGATKGTIESDFIIKLMGMEARQTMKMTITADVVK